MRTSVTRKRDPGAEGEQRSGSLRPLVTVVVPTHNRPAELRRAIDTVRGQTLAEWELVIVDDGSLAPVDLDPDAVADGRIRLVRHSSNLGVSQARNTGIAHATAPWIAFLDDDDIWCPEKLAAQLAAAAAQGSTFVFTGRYTVNPAGAVISIRPPAWTDSLTRSLLRHNYIGEPSSVMVHRDALNAAGGFDPDLAIVADWDMWLRLSCVAVPHGMSDLTTAIVVHEDSMQMTHSSRIPRELAAMRDRYADLLATEQMELGSRRTEFWMANKRWRGERDLASFLGYLRVAHRHHELGRLAARKLLRAAAGEPARSPAPRWVLEQLGTTPSVMPSSLADSSVVRVTRAQARASEV
jgi:GT2 family glycosyltransferase